MTEILTTIQQLKQKGTDINNNLGSFAASNQQFKQSLFDNLSKISDALKQLNLSEFRNNKQLLVQANEELEVSKRQLQEKQNELAEATRLLEEAQRNSADANKALQDKAAEIQALEQQKQEALAQMQEEQQKTLAESQNASAADKQALMQKCEEEKKQLQSEFEQQRAALEEEKKNAVAAAEKASQEMSQIQSTYAEIQSGLNDIGALLDSQLNMINSVINSSPSVGDLNSLVDTIQMNLAEGIKILSGTAQATASQVTAKQRGFALPPSLQEFRNNTSSQARQNFYAAVNGNKLNELIREGEKSGDMSAAEALYSELLREYNQKYGRTSGGRRRVTRKRKSKRNLTKRMRRQQKGGYTYGKEDASLKKTSSVVSVGSNSASVSGKNSPLYKSFLVSKHRTRKARGVQHRRATKKRSRK